MSTDKQIIAVVGATGTQGGGLVRALLADPEREFLVRAITRKPNSERAVELARLGAEVVTADIDDAASLARAFRGAYGAFCVTNFWEHFSTDKEVAQAKALADAVKSEGVERVVWSTLEDTRRYIPLSDDRIPTLQGKYKVPHFDGKGEADQFFRETGAAVTYLIAGFYWENLIYYPGLGPTRGPDGKVALVMALGDGKLPGIAAEDIGPGIFGVFKSGPEYVGKYVGLSGEHLTGAEMAARLSEFLGPVGYSPLTPEGFRALGFPGADDLGNMFRHHQDFNRELCELRDVEVTRKLHPRVKTFTQWLETNASRIPIS
jgi:uncharacterized protein YbjT (DUF2867 family)